MSEPGTFQYDALTEQSTSFRLLRLLPKRNALYECKLEHTDLSDCVPYEALSYTWGSSEKVEPVLVNGKLLDITDNLYAALQHLAYPDKERVLWIDGICIDQSNDAEKSRQVQRMIDIYSQAARVIFWLGKATLEVRVFMEYMAHLKTLLPEQLTLEQACSVWSSMPISQTAREQARNGLQTLLRRPWFKRVWILQEVANARNGLLCAGSTSIPAETFALSTFILNTGPSDATTYWQPVIDIMPGPSRDQSWWASRPDLYTLFQRFRASNATDPRDMIYALLGLSQDARDRSAVTVDYAKPLHRVIQSVLPRFLESKHSRIDHVLNLAFETSGLATILVVVNRKAVSDMKYFDCEQRTLQTNADTWLRQTLVDQLGVISTLAVAKHDARLLMQDLQPDQSDPESDQNSSLYSEIMTVLEFDYRGHGGIGTIPSIGHWGPQAGNVKLLVLRQALACKYLTFAARRGFINLLQLVLDLDLVDRDDALKCNAVYEAIKSGSAEMVQHLLDYGFSPDGNATQIDNSPLCYAIESRNIEIMKLLIERGAKVNATTLMDYGAKAMKSGSAEIVQYLLDYGFSPGSDATQIALHTAIESRNIKMMKLLIERGANVNATTPFDHGAITYLARAIANNDQAAFELLVKSGADCKADRQALWSACQHGREYALETLLHPGADLDFLLYSMVLCGRDPSWLSMALKHGANPNLLIPSDYKNFGSFDGYPRQSILQVAVQQDYYMYVDTMKVLLEHGAYVNMVSDHDTLKTALHAALYERHIKKVDFLLENGAHVDSHAYEVLKLEPREYKYWVLIARASAEAIAQVRDV